MAIRKEGKTLIVELEGAIGEACPLFGQVLNGITEVKLDLNGVTYISSIGVKQWVMWTVRIPRDCSVTIHNTPFVIVVQASTVLGFYTPRMRIESIKSPYVCEDCGTEIIRPLQRGVDYDYSTPTTPKWVKVPPESECPKCGKKAFGPDFLIEKSFRFLA